MVVSSRNIAENFNKRHSEVIRAIENKIEVNAILHSPKYFIENTYTDKSNRKSKEYLLTRDGFSFIVMGFTGKEADSWKLKYIDAFNKMESELVKQSEKMLPNTYKEALIQLLETVEQNELLLEENKILKPKSEYHDNVLSKEGLINTTVIAKDLGFKSAIKLNKVLFMNKIIFKNNSGTWCPYAKYEWLITDGYADYKSYENEKSKPCLKWTELGRKWIIDNYKEWEANTK